VDIEETGSREVKTLRCDGKPQTEMAGPLHFQPTALQIALQ
jgi:hypothetical protein